jgi:hypothetical protein
VTPQRADPPRSDGERNATAPDDLIAALRFQNPGAERSFEQLGKTGPNIWLWWAC